MRDQGWWAMLCLGLIGLIGLAMLPGLHRPWVQQHDFAGAAFATMARNHVEFGPRATRWASVLEFDRRHPSQSPVYAHHPFGYPLALAGLFCIGGASEGVARGASLACTLAGLWCLARLVRQLHSPALAFGTLVAAALMPVVLFYGRLVSLEPPVVAANLWTLERYAAWDRSPTRARWWAMLAALGLGLASDWQAYYLAVLLPCDQWCGGLARRRPGIWALPAVALVSLVAFGWHLAWADPRQVSDLAEAFWFRTGWMPAERQLAGQLQLIAYGPAEFLARLAWNSAVMFTPPVALAGGWGMALLGAQAWANARLRPLARIVVLLAGPAVIHTLVFPNVFYVHDCLLLLYYPSLAVGAAWLAREWWGRAPLVGPRLWWALAAAVVCVATSAVPVVRLHRAWHLDPWHYGREIAAVARPRELVWVVGRPFHPAAEWYARRTLRFVDRRSVGDIAAEVPEVAAGLLDAVSSGHEDAELNPTAARLRARTAESLAIVRRDYRPVATRQGLQFWRRREP